MATTDDYVDFDPDRLGGRSCTVAHPVKGVGFFKRATGGRGKFGHVQVLVRPHPGIHGYRFRWPEAAAMALPHAFMREACLAGVTRALREPLDDGRQVVFVEVSVENGSWHECDTDEDSMERASHLAVRDALRQARLAEA